MKKIAIVVVSIFFFSACKKDTQTVRELTGTWRLITVYDKVATGTIVVPKPAGETGDILLTFGKFKSYSGKTFKRTYNNGTYSINNNNELEFSFPKFSGGSEDDEWGFAFLVMLTACSLQSITPCVPTEINFDNNRLTVNTALRYNFLFEKVE